MHNRIVSTIDKHIEAKQFLPCGNVSIRINKPPDFGIIVTALQIIQPCFHIVVIPTVAEEGADGVIDKNSSLLVYHTLTILSRISLRKRSSLFNMPNYNKKITRYDMLQKVVRFRAYIRG